MSATCQSSDLLANVDVARGRGRSILILNQAFYPDVVSTAQHTTDLALALAEAGYRVTVVTGARAYDGPSQTFPARESWRGMEIIRVGSTAFGKTARWRRAADFATYMGACAARAALLPPHDLAIALTSPPLISWLGAQMVPLKTRALLFWAMDLNPDEAIAAGWLSERSIAGRLLAGMQLQSMRRAARIVALDRFMKDRLVAKGLNPPGSTSSLRGRMIRCVSSRAGANSSAPSMASTASMSSCIPAITAHVTRWTR